MPPFRRTQPLVSGKRGIASALSAPAGAPLAADAATRPKLENAGFESDLSGWSKAAAPTFQVKTQGAAQGVKYVAISGTKRVEARGTITGLVRGQNYTLSFQSRGNTSKDARLILRNLQNQKYLRTATPSEAAGWKTTILKFAAPSAEVGVEISLRSAGTFDLDDLVVKRAD